MERKKLLIIMGSICLVLIMAAIPIMTACAPTPEPAPAPAPEPAPIPLPAPTGEPYKIGLVTSITGFMAPMGTGARDAALLAVDKINGEGGINGHPLELIIYDDASDPSKGVLAVKKLVEEDEVLGITGPVSSGIAIACATVSEEAQVPHFAFNSTSWSVVEKPWDIPNPPTNIRHWVFKYGIDTLYQDLALYEMLRDLDAVKLAHMNEANAMGKAWRASAEATAEGAGFDVLIWEEMGPEDTDMTAQLTKIKAMNVDAIILISAAVVGGITYKQARELGMTQPIVGPPPLLMRNIVDILGDSLNGLRVPAYPAMLGEELPLDDPQREAILELAKPLEAETGVETPDTGHISGWDGVLLFADALRMADPDLTDLAKARLQVRDAMENIKGFVGSYCIGDMTKWHEIATPMIPVEFRDGKLVVVGEKITPTWADFE